MGWLIALGILVLLALLPVGVRFRYNDHGFRLKLLVGFLPISLLPPKKKKKPEEKSPAREKKEKKPSKKQQKPSGDQPKEKGGSWKDFLPLVDIALDFLKGFCRKIRIDRLELKVILAGDDPCDLAVNYGRAWAAVGNLMPRLENTFRIHRRNVEVECDFENSTTTVIAGAKITISLGGLLSLAAVLAYRGLREYRNIKQKRKGGAAK